MNNTDMGTKIKELRKSNNMTQKEVGDLINVSDKTVSKWERGNGYPDMETLPQLAKAFDVSPSVFFSDQDETEITSVENVVNNTLDYARKKEVMKNQTFIKVITTVVTAMWFIGSFACLIVDFSISKTITWSIMPISSLTFAWLISVPALLMKSNKLAVALTAFSVLLTPYLWVLSRATPSSEWFKTIALPIAVAMIILAWVVFFLRQSKMKNATVVASLFLFIPVVDLILDLIVHRSIAAYFADGWNIIILMGSVIITATIILFTRLYGSTPEEEKE